MIRAGSAGWKQPIIPGSQDRILFKRPDMAAFRDQGYTPVDMHVHTCHSDGAPSVRRILIRAERNGFGFAITDHNEVSGIRELTGSKPPVLVIPGIEIDCAEGPHILLYFFQARDLIDFYDCHLKKHRRGSQYMTACPPVDEVLSAAEGYPCLKIAAHPFGYFCLDRGVLKCVAKDQLNGIMDRMDGIEAICGGMSRKLNQKAATYANQYHLPVTGGSDAHILSGIGSVVTGAKADSAEEFLGEIIRCRSIVTGLPGGIISRGLTAGVIGYHYLPYSVTALKAWIEPHSSRFRETFISHSRDKNKR